jgi:hypothetical protein
MSENDQTQAAVDRLFGVGEPRTRPEDIDRGVVKPGRNAVYSRALLEARELFPDDGIAAHRFAEREAERVMRITEAAATSSRRSQKLLVDQAFLEIFGGLTGGAGGRLEAIEFLPDRVIARGMAGKLYRVPYTVSAEGVAFGAPQMVENLADEQQH